MNGKLIVIEGLDGSGKNTQTKLLLEYMSQKTNVRHISFPDYNSPSSSLIKMYLNSEFGGSPSDVNAYAAASFYAVDRYASFKKDWEKSYLNGEIILCDRYTTSNYIYQLSKLDKKYWDEFLFWLDNYEYEKLQIPKPDLVIYLKVPVEISQKLMTSRYSGNELKKDLHESDILFLENCAKSADYVSKKYNWKIINCTDNQNNILSKELIHEKIVESLLIEQNIKNNSM